MKKKDLYIVGAGSVGGHIASNQDLYLLEYDNIYFLDDDANKINKSFVGCHVKSSIDFLYSIKHEVDVVIGIAFPKIKKLIHHKINTISYLQFPTLIANNAWVSKDVNIGKGTIIYPNCSINYGSKIGDFVVMNMNCALGHHAKIGNYTSLAPGVNFGGHTHLGDCVDMGIGSSTIQGITIGDNTIVGGQTMILDSIKSNSKVVGIPARYI